MVKKQGKDSVFRLAKGGVPGRTFASILPSPSGGTFSLPTASNRGVSAPLAAMACPRKTQSGHTSLYKTPRPM